MQLCEMLSVWNPRCVPALHRSTLQHTGVAPLQDPKAKKPEDWDDNPMIDDPEDKKPADWDDVPKTVPDPEAKKPADWDDDDDGEWSAPEITNPEWRGEWRPRRIENPAYKACFCRLMRVGGATQ